MGTDGRREIGTRRAVDTDGGGERPPESLAPLVFWPAERQRRARIEAMLGPTEGLPCLEIGGADGGLGWFLRRRGGNWSSAELDPDAAHALEALIGAPVAAVGEDGRLPFEDETFDLVLVVDRLERAADDAALIRECHRVLKPAGRLVLHVMRARYAARTPPGGGTGGRRAGYSEADLFEVLKDGFDVQEVAGYGRPFAEGADRLGWRIVEQARDAARAARLAAPAVWLISRLDVLLPFARGRRIILRAKRRLWIPRRRPVLRDGRSIAEATLGTRIGSASPLAAAKRPDARKR